MTVLVVGVEVEVGFDVDVVVDVEQGEYVGCYQECWPPPRRWVLRAISPLCPSSLLLSNESLRRYVLQLTTRSRSQRVIKQEDKGPRR